MFAGGTFGAEAALVPETLLDFGLGCDVEENTLFRVTACAEIAEELALRHL
jgi:hypothetical protein